MKEFIKFLENNPDLIKMNLNRINNLLTNVEADIVIENKIISPSTALDLAEIYEEILNIVVALDFYTVELPFDIKQDLLRLAKKNLVNFISLSHEENRNDGNLAILLDAVVNNKSVNFGLLNFNESKAIDVNINSNAVKGSV